MSRLPARFKLQPLREADIPAILEIEQKVNTAPWSERSFRNELNHPHGILLVATADTKVVGYGGVWLVVDEAHITTVAVDENQRRLGIGRALVTELLKQAKAAGMVCATLEVRAGNAAAIALYEHMGFKGVAHRRAYYPDDKEDALVMWLYGLQEWEPPA